MCEDEVSYRQRANRSARLSAFILRSWSRLICQKLRALLAGSRRFRLRSRKTEHASELREKLNLLKVGKNRRSSLELVQGGLWLVHMRGCCCVSFLVKCSCSSIRLCDEPSFDVAAIRGREPTHCIYGNRPFSSIILKLPARGDAHHPPLHPAHSLLLFGRRHTYLN